MTRPRFQAPPKGQPCARPAPRVQGGEEKGRDRNRRETSDKPGVRLRGRGEPLSGALPITSATGELAGRRGGSSTAAQRTWSRATARGKGRSRPRKRPARSASGGREGSHWNPRASERVSGKESRCTIFWSLNWAGLFPMGCTTWRQTAAGSAERGLALPEVFAATGHALASVAVVMEYFDQGRSRQGELARLVAGTVAGSWW